MKELTNEDICELAVLKGDGNTDNGSWSFSDVGLRKFVKNVIAADRTINAADQSVMRQAVTEEMITAYLEANDRYWRETDAQPHTKPSKWRNGTPSEATRVSLEAALAVALTPERHGDPAEPRDDSDHTYTKPIGYLPAYELSRLHSGHDAQVRSAKFGPSTLDGDIPVFIEAPTPSAEQQEGQAPVAFFTRNSEGCPSMLFFDAEEATQYCDDNEAPEPLYAATPAPSAEPQGVAEVMEQAQVFASAWALIGGKFDRGTAVDLAKEAEAELRIMVTALVQELGEWKQKYGLVRDIIGEQLTRVGLERLKEDLS